MIGVGDYRTTPAIRKNVADVLESGRVSYGKYTRQAEKLWAEHHGTKHAIAVANGTAALHISVMALAEKNRWVKGRSEIIVPAVTFVATLNAIVQAGYVPRLADVDPRDALLDPTWAKRAINADTVGVIPVHLFGQAASFDMIDFFRNGMGLAVIEDSAEAVKAKSMGHLVGSMGDMGCFSTYVAHHVTAGTGGFITTNDDELNDIARSLVNHGRDIAYFDPDQRKPGDSEIQFLFHRSGLNYRSSELTSAVVCGILEDIDSIIERRREIAATYTELLSDLYRYGLETTSERMGNFHSWMMYPLLAEWVYDRSEKYEMMEYLWKSGIDTRECLPLVNQPYINKMGFVEDFYPAAKRWNVCGFYLPCHQYMTDDEVEMVALTVREYVLEKRS